MANSNTEHSKKLRASTAAARNKKLLESGQMRQILLKLDSDVASEFDAVLAELGNSRPQAIKALCKFYRENKSR